jgi:hypothetical protein
MIWGVAIGAGMLSAFLGTLGWAGTMLLVFAATGRWFRAPSTPAHVPDDD